MRVRARDVIVDGAVGMERMRWATQRLVGRSHGAVDLGECPRPNRYGRPDPRVSTCYCQPACRVCGYGKHTAVHGPEFGEPPGSRPWHHEYVPGEGLPEYGIGGWNYIDHPRQEWPITPPTDTEEQER